MSESTQNKAVNYLISRNGSVSAVCQCCGKRSKYAKPDYDGQPNIWKLSTGWAHAPYPKDFVHKDGSNGSIHTCPSCEKRLSNGETLKLRSYLLND